MKKLLFLFLLLFIPTVYADNFILESNITKTNNTLFVQFGEYSQKFDLTMGDFSFSMETVVPTNISETFLLKFDDVNKSITSTILFANTEQQYWFENDFIYQINKTSSCEADRDIFKHKAELYENNLTNIMNFGLKNCQELVESERDVKNIFLWIIGGLFAMNIVLFGLLSGKLPELVMKMRGRG